MPARARSGPCRPSRRSTPPGDQRTGQHEHLRIDRRAGRRPNARRYCHAVEREREPAEELEARRRRRASTSERGAPRARSRSCRRLCPPALSAEQLRNRLTAADAKASVAASAPRAARRRPIVARRTRQHARVRGRAHYRRSRALRAPAARRRRSGSRRVAVHPACRDDAGDRGVERRLAAAIGPGRMCQPSRDRRGRAATSDGRADAATAGRWPATTPRPPLAACRRAFPHAAAPPVCAHRRPATRPPPHCRR